MDRMTPKRKRDQQLPCPALVRFLQPSTKLLKEHSQGLQVQYSTVQYRHYSTAHSTIHRTVGCTKSCAPATDNGVSLRHASVPRVTWDYLTMACTFLKSGLRTYAMQQYMYCSLDRVTLPCRQ